MERIFNNSNIGTIANYGDGPEGEYEFIIRERIEDSVDFEESYLAFERQDNQGYYNGTLPGLSEAENEDDQPNRSTYVSTDVRDTILAIMPSLMRIFTNFDQKVAEFVPTKPGQEEQDKAEQAYDYINYIFFNDNPGFITLHSVIKDALTVKYGVTKWWTDNEYEVVEKPYTNVSREILQSMIYADSSLQVVNVVPDPTDDRMLQKVVTRSVVNKPITRCVAVPPEEFRIARDAKDVESASLVGHERLVPVHELVALGYDVEYLSQFVSQARVFSEERYMRNPGLADDRVITGVNYGEWYIRIDGDGDGIAELRYICTMGDNYFIVHDEIVPYPKFAVWGVDPRPHTIIGDCVADITKDIQRIKTAMTRGQLDNLAESINPKTVVNELLTNIEDVLNDEVGAIIRTRGDAGAAVQYKNTPYTGDQVQTSLEYLDRVRASRTGITEASKGLDPKAMQSTAQVGINAIVTGAQERIELIARVLAETGLRATIRGLLREITDNQNPDRVVKLRGKWVNVTPSSYDVTMTLEVNPTLGKGTDAIRIQTLSLIKDIQTMVIDKFGPDNPLVSPIEFRNTLSDLLSLANIKNVGRYFKEITQEQLQAIADQPKEPDPAMVLAQAELEKVKKDVIVAMGKLDAEKDKIRLQGLKMALDRMDMLLDDDFRRDKLTVDTMMQVAKLGQELVQSSAERSANSSPEDIE